MKRVLSAISVLVLSACTAPPRYIQEPLGPIQLAIAPSDTTAVRQLCADPERVVAGRRPCLLRGTERSSE